MPELPEVETIVRGLRAARIEGRLIKQAEVRWARITEGIDPHVFERAVTGQRIDRVERRAKFIVIRLSGRADLLVHLRMTGQLRFERKEPGCHKHDHVLLKLDDERWLIYRDPRKFGRWRLCEDVDKTLGPLGPEPLDAAFTSAVFHALMRRRKGMLKPLLLNQRILAGLGNIYVDEALWEAGLHPRRRAETVGIEAWQRLYRAIRTVLRRGIRAGGTSLGAASTNFHSVSGRRGGNQAGLRVFRRTGEACPRCGGTIVRILVGQRSSHVCPACQPPQKEQAEGRTPCLQAF